RRDAELLMHHGDAGGMRIAGGAEPSFLSVQQQAAGEFRMQAGDDLHQRAFARAVLADETVDLAGGEREVDPAQRLDAAEGLADPLEFEDGGRAVRHGRLKSGSGSPSTACRPHWPWSQPDR